MGHLGVLGGIPERARRSPNAPVDLGGHSSASPLLCTWGVACGWLPTEQHSDPPGARGWLKQGHPGPSSSQCGVTEEGQLLSGSNAGQNAVQTLPLPM